MNNDIIKKWQIGSIIFSVILGSLLHFTYACSNGNAFVAAFSSVNESTWEHLKLAFFPMLLVTIIQYFFVSDKVNNYIESKTIGIFTTILFITSFFYTYTGIIGNNFAIINIITFIIGIILGEYIAYIIMLKESDSSKLTKILSIIILLVLCFYFILFTYITPKLNYFKDPITGGYGTTTKFFNTTIPK